MDDTDNKAADIQAKVAAAMVDGGPQATPQPPVYGTLEAVVQTYFPFQGERRAPGDILTPEMLSKVSHTTLMSLKNQGHIILQPEGSHKTHGAVTEVLEEFEDRLSMVEGRADEVEALRQELVALKSSLPQAIEAYLMKREAQQANVAARTVISDPMAIPSDAGTRKIKGA